MDFYFSASRKCFYFNYASKCLNSSNCSQVMTCESTSNYCYSLHEIRHHGQTQVYFAFAPGSDSLLSFTEMTISTTVSKSNLGSDFSLCFYIYFSIVPSYCACKINYSLVTAIWRFEEKKNDSLFSRSYLVYGILKQVISEHG